MCNCRNIKFYDCTPSQVTPVSVFHWAPQCLCHAELGSEEECPSAHTSEAPGHRQGRAGQGEQGRSVVLTAGSNQCKSMPQWDGVLIPITDILWSMNLSQLLLYSCLTQALWLRWLMLQQVAGPSAVCSPQLVEGDQGAGRTPECWCEVSAGCDQTHSIS